METRDAGPGGRLGPILGSALFFVVVPGTVAGGIPFWLTGWRVEPASDGGRAAGLVLMLVGLGSLVDSFARFALVGFGTPAPVAPPERLVVSGQYRHVRNPMYAAILTLLLGQSLLFRSLTLLGYAALVGSVFHLWILVYEERALRARFGPAYDAYCRNVARWMPRLRPWRG